MATDFRKRILERSKLDTFRQTLGLTGATTLGIGALMGAGLYVLVGIAAAAAGPGLWLAYVICGVLTAFSVLMFADFARRLPVAGGGYVYAYRQLGSFWGFMVGFHLAVGSIFACALYAYGFSTYFLSMFTSGVPVWAVKAVAVGITLSLTVVGLLGGKGGDSVQRIFTWGNLAVILVLVAVALPLFRTARFDPMLPRGIGGVGGAISLIYISFFGYQLIANSAEEIRDAPNTVPRAMGLSMLVAAVIYLVVAFVSVAAVDYRELAGSDAPLMLVAVRAVGSWGGWLVGAGGVLASVAALNGTLLSQGRQIYAMGRDRLLPDRLGRLSEGAKVPIYAMVAGGAVTSSVLLLADLAFIAKAANFALLFSMLPISFALHRLYQRLPEEEDAVPRWRRLVPWAAFAANTGLLLTLDWDSLLFGGTMVGTGCAVFLSYSYASEKRGQAGFSVDLADNGRSGGRMPWGERILVPMANPRTQESLFSISEALLPPSGGEIVVLNVVVADEGVSPREALQKEAGTADAVDVFSRVSDFAETRGVTFTPVVRAATSLAEGIAHAADEKRCQLIVMGWAAQDDGSPSSLLDDVVSRVRTDLVFLQLTHDVEPKRIGVALGARSNLSLMVRVASTLADQYNGEVTYLNVVPVYFDRQHLRHARQVHMEALHRHVGLVRCHTEILCSDNPLGALAERSEDLDLLVVGSARAGPYGEGAVGTFSAMIAQKARCSVVIVRSAPSSRRMLPPPVEALRDLGVGFRRKVDPTNGG